MGVTSSYRITRRTFRRLRRRLWVRCPRCLLRGDSAPGRDIGQGVDPAVQRGLQRGPQPVGRAVGRAARDAANRPHRGRRAGLQLHPAVRERLFDALGLQLAPQHGRRPDPRPSDAHAAGRGVHGHGRHVWPGFQGPPAPRREAALGWQVVDFFVGYVECEAKAAEYAARPLAVEAAVVPASAAAAEAASATASAIPWCPPASIHLAWRHELFVRAQRWRAVDLVLPFCSQRPWYPGSPAGRACSCASSWRHACWTLHAATQADVSTVGNSCARCLKRVQQTG
ncbi:hypothetical protein BKA81DRAFT_30934 [Phyllosticta paracitricarpa]